MQITNELRRQASKAGFLFTAVFLLGAAAVAQASENSAKEKPEPTARPMAVRIVVSVPDRKLALIQDGEVKKVFPVAVGKDSTPSPSGSFHIVNRLTKPTYYHKGKVIASGPVNPLGTRWMGLSEHGYGIHGTNVPSSIGNAASHGCIRMARADLEQLFELVKVGDAVEIRAERDEETVRVFGATTGTTTNTLLAEAGNDPRTRIQ
jgi:lipoprotein-anchoring transpeptidase ErfK/SrfK